MKRVILVILGALLVLAICIYLGGVFFLGNLVKTGVNRFGPRVTQSKVELAAANLSPLTGTGTLTGLTVGNPAGWSDGRAFYLGRVDFSVEPRSVFRDTIVINELTIDAPELNYETKFVASNIQDIVKNIESYAGGGGNEPAAKGGAPKKFILKKFRLTNAKATVGVGTAAVAVPLPAISLDNLGVAEGGITGSQLAAAITRDVLRNVAASATGVVGQLSGAGAANALEKTKEAAKQLGDSLKSIFKKKP